MCATATIFFWISHIGAIAMPKHKKSWVELAEIVLDHVFRVIYVRFCVMQDCFVHTDFRCQIENNVLSPPPGFNQVVLAMMPGWPLKCTLALRASCQWPCQVSWMPYLHHTLASRLSCLQSIPASRVSCRHPSRFQGRHACTAPQCRWHCIGATTWL